MNNNFLANRGLVSYAATSEAGLMTVSSSHADRDGFLQGPTFSPRGL